MFVRADDQPGWGEGTYSEAGLVRHFYLLLEVIDLHIHVQLSTIEYNL